MTNFLPSSTDKSAIKIAYETAPGTPGTSPLFYQIPFVSSDVFGPQVNKAASKTITPTRGIRSLNMLSKAAKSAFVTPLVFGVIDPLLEGSLMNTFVNKPTIVNLPATGQITSVANTDSKFNVTSGGASFLEGHIVKASGFTNSANNGIFLVSGSASGYISVTELDGTSVSLTNEASPPLGAKFQVVGWKAGADDIDATSSGLTSTVLDFTTLGFSPGERIKIGGSDAGSQFTTAENNGFCRISAIAAHALTFDIVPEDFSAEVSSGGIELEFFMGDRLRDGSNYVRFYQEKSFNDRDPVTYTYVSKGTVDTLSLAFKANDVGQLTWSLNGGDATGGTTRYSGARDYSNPNTEEMTSSANVAGLYQGATLVAPPNFVTGFQIDISNGLQPIMTVGSPYSQGDVFGKCNITGTLSILCGDNYFINQILTDAEAAVGVPFFDQYDQYYWYELPRIGYADGAETISGENAIVSMEAKIQALEHLAFGYTMQIQRFAYIPTEA